MNPLLLFGLASSLMTFQASPHVDEVRGFRIDVPEGWTTVEQDQADGSFMLYVVPPDSDGRVLVAVTVRDMGPDTGAEDLVALSLATIEESDVYSELERSQTPLLGEPRTTLHVRMRTAAGPLSIAATFLVADGHGFVLQRAAPPSELERWTDELEAVVATFAPVVPSEEGREERRLAALAARCGSEVDWAASWDEAAARARASERPVLVVAWLYGGFSLPTSPRSTTFMDEAVLELVATRFVPYWHHAGEPAAFVERYGLSPTAFGQALLVVTPDGEVVAESERAAESDCAYAFLRSVLAERFEEPAGRDSTPGGSTSELELARDLVARGRVEEALEALEAADAAEELLLRARSLRLLRRGKEALAALERARAMAEGCGPELERTVLVEGALLNMRSGRTGPARSDCEALLASHPDSEEARAAELGLAWLDLEAGAAAEARARLVELTTEHEDSRSAWQAAALLQGGLLELDVPLDSGWPEEALLAEELVRPAPTPLPSDRAREARDQALAWLIGTQRPDGSWISPTELSSAKLEGPSPFVDAVTALALRALLPHRERAGVSDAAERALAFVLASIERRASTPTRVLYMDYTPWSDAAMLDALAAAREAGLGAPDALRGVAESLAGDLCQRLQPHGGWGYYVTADLDGAGAPPTAMSFTTAAVVLALVHALDAELQLPTSEPAGQTLVWDLALEAGVRSLAAMRDAEGVFAYSLSPGGRAGVARGMLAGAAGRGPVCELALVRAGESDEQRLARALELFLEHSASLAAEQGKVLMHAGPQAQGCHYVLFDYAWAAAAWREIEGDARTRVRLLELLLDCRQASGAFLDTPINGRAYGTAMALLSLDDLDA